MRILVAGEPAFGKLDPEAEVLGKLEMGGEHLAAERVVAEQGEAKAGFGIGPQPVGAAMGAEVGDGASLLQAVGSGPRAGVAEMAQLEFGPQLGLPAAPVCRP
jgi:hypothetical protein